LATVIISPFGRCWEMEHRTTWYHTIKLVEASMELFRMGVVDTTCWSSNAFSRSSVARGYGKKKSFESEER